MLRLFSSFRARVLIILSILMLVFFGGTIGQPQLIGYLDSGAEQMQTTLNLRAELFILETDLYHYLDQTTDAGREAVLEDINAIITLIDARYRLLRGGGILPVALMQDEGDQEPVTALTYAPALETLDEFDADWERFQLAFNEFLSNPADAELLETAEDLVEDAAESAGELAELVEDDLENAEAFIPFVRVVFLMIAGTVTSIGFVTVRQIFGQLADLDHTAEQISLGNLDVRSQSTGLVEFARVSTTVNGMAEQLQALVVELQKNVQEAHAARDQAERADRVKSAFLASVSHELRTPLNSILNYTKFVQKGVMGPVTDRQVDTLEKVVRSGKHLLTLINDVLDISKIESGSLQLFIEDDVNLNEILDSALNTTVTLLEDKPVELRREIQPDMPLLTGDRQRVLQIMLNILSNAVKFTDTGYIQVRAKYQDGEYQLQVKDTGPGIAPEDFATVFVPFKQTETGLRQGSGTGLGMPISRSLAEAHGGKMWLESTPGAGATFYVTLPQKRSLPPAPKDLPRVELETVEAAKPLIIA